jgi:hypothetical protein
MLGGLASWISIMQPQPNDREIFDAICLFRERYAQQGPMDRDVALSVGAAVVYGEGLMRIVRRREEHAARRRATPTD